jgi:hypothetical protein
MLILKTQKPEYFSICQCKIRELERENQRLKVDLEVVGHNCRFYHDRLEKVLKHLGQIKELKRGRGLPSPNSELRNAAPVTPTNTNHDQTH